MTSEDGRISLCIITGNEEKTIERFLDSFSGAFDELCIVRAIGNQVHDRTISLAKSWCGRNGKSILIGEHTNCVSGKMLPEKGKVMDNDPATWPHVDDFSAARNASWSLATCPWQLWADVDDMLIPGAAEIIRLCAASGSHDQYFFAYDLRGQSESNVRERLFRTGISEWVQPVHEQCRPCRPPADGGQWRALIETRVVYEHCPTAEKQRDPMRNRRIMTYHVRWIHAYAFELHREWFYQWQATKDPMEADQATRWAEVAHNTQCMPEQRFDMLLHQAQIAAEADLEHAIDLCWSAIRISPKNRSGWGDLAEYELRAGRGGRAAVMTGFMQSLPRPAETGYPLSERYHGWEGAHLRIRSLRAAGREDQARQAEDQLFAKNGRRVSLLHATRGRWKQAVETRNLWHRAAFRPLGVEHIFAVDADDRESLEGLKHYRHVVVKEPWGCVRAWNAAAAVCSGHMLVQLSDDWLPCHDWDELVWESLIAGARKRGAFPLNTIGDDAGLVFHSEPMVLAIDDGHRKDDLLCMAILTRARYEQQGGVMFSPEYFGVYSDNEFTHRAYKDGVVVDARNIVFQHRHPVFEGKPFELWDETHRRQNSAERYAEGKAIFDRRNPNAHVE